MGRGGGAWFLFSTERVLLFGSELRLWGRKEAAAWGFLFQYTHFTWYDISIYVQEEMRKEIWEIPCLNDELWSHLTDNNRLSFNEYLFSLSLLPRCSLSSSNFLQKQKQRIVEHRVWNSQDYSLICSVKVADWMSPDSIVLANSRSNWPVILNVNSPIWCAAMLAFYIFYLALQYFLGKINRASHLTNSIQSRSNRQHLWDST